MRNAQQQRLFLTKQRFLFSSVSITLIFFIFFLSFKNTAVLIRGVFICIWQSLQFRHKFSKNYLNFLSNFVTIFWIGSCMIIPDKQMKHLYLRPAARPEFDSKAADNLFLFSRQICRKRFHIFFLFSFSFPKNCRGMIRGFFHASVIHIFAIISSTFLQKEFFIWSRKAGNFAVY